MNIPRPEHPFPQMERDNWLNLNGEWQFEFDFGRSGKDRKLHLQKSLKDKIIVPFCPESELSGINYKDFIPAVWYKRDLLITKEQLSGRVLLHFGAVDYKASIYINGTDAGTHLGGYSSFQLDISPYIVEGSNTITVQAEDDTKSGLQPSGKQSKQYYSSGCDYTRTTGIWQTVWVEYVPTNYIRTVKYYPNITEGQLYMNGTVSGAGTLTATAYYQGRKCGEVSVKTEYGNFSAMLSLDEVHLWGIGEGNLYDLELTFDQDKVKSYFGLREIKMDGMKCLLNGKSIFQRLILDQGFYPDGIYTAPSEDALIQDIHLSMDMGFNGARLHEKVFEARFLYHCDKLGYLVWGEHANWGLDLSNPSSLISFLPEWLEILERDFNHPSIIGWCPFNETWDYDGRKQNDDIIKIIYQTTKRFDPTRPCIDTSGNFHVITDIYDHHCYDQDVELFASHYEGLKTGGDIVDSLSNRQHYVKGLPVFISEYGGIKWDIEDSSNSWGYGEAPKTREEFLARYDGLTTALLDNPKIFGLCYTQLYDVEQEKNGLYTYGRVAKFDPSIIKAINSKKAAIES